MHDAVAVVQVARSRVDRRPLAVCLMGPTAAGKTELALALVAALPCTIISVDSAMIYRGMDIGTAKPNAATRAAAPHHLIDICDPTESYSAARFRAEALELMAAISAAGRIPLLVGGTMLYFRALEQGLAPLPSADPETRARLAEAARREGLAALHRRLAEVDPASAQRIHPNDPQRLLRALEVYEASAQPLSRLIETAPAAPVSSHRLLKLVRAPRDRTELHRRIAQRFHHMLAQGFEEEVRGLWNRGDLTADLPSMRCVGYRQMLNYLMGAYTYEMMIERAIVATRQLAKRQYTWLRAQADALWLFDDQSPTERAVSLVRAAWES